MPEAPQWAGGSSNKARHPYSVFSYVTPEGNKARGRTADTAIAVLPKPPVRRLNLRARGIAGTPDYLILKEVVYSNVRTSYPLSRAAVTSAVTLTGGAAILIQHL